MLFNLFELYTAINTFLVFSVCNDAVLIHKVSCYLIPFFFFCSKWTYIVIITEKPSQPLFVCIAITIVLQHQLYFHQLIFQWYICWYCRPEKKWKWCQKLSNPDRGPRHQDSESLWGTQESWCQDTKHNWDNKDRNIILIFREFNVI